MRHVLTILAVGDVDAAARFYGEALGWRRTVNAPVYAELVAADGMRLGLYERHAFGKNVGRAPRPSAAGELCGTELYFYADGGDLDGAATRLRAAGARELSPPAPRDWGDDVAYFADPEGNVIAVARPHAG